MNANKLKAAGLTWKKVYGSAFFEVSHPCRFVAISVKGCLKSGQRGPVVDRATWTVVASGTNDSEKLVLASGVAEDMHAAKRLSQTWWNRAVRSLRRSVVAIHEGD